MLPLYRKLNAKVRINLRDEISKKRFEASTGRVVTLVADSAFMLRADTSAPEVLTIKTWVDSQKASGFSVVGLNIHPMLYGKLSLEEQLVMIEHIAPVFHNIGLARKTKWLLICHDFRPNIGDKYCVESLERALQNLGTSTRAVTDVEDSRKLKAIAGLTDGVISGRMHLLIAALGMGAPVAAFTYKDKFEGLFQHFNLSSDLMLPPSSIRNNKTLQSFVEHFLDIMHSERSKVSAALPRINALSELNLENLV